MLIGRLFLCVYDDDDAERGVVVGRFILIFFSFLHVEQKTKIKQYLNNDAI